MTTLTNIPVARERGEFHLPPHRLFFDSDSPHTYTISTGSSDHYASPGDTLESTSGPYFSRPLFIQVDPAVLKRQKQLKKKLDSESGKYAHYLTELPDENCVYPFFNSLAELPFKGAAVELVPDDQLKVTLVLPSEYLLMISTPTNKPGAIPVFTLFHNREPLISDQRPLEEIIEGIFGMLLED